MYPPDHSSQPHKSSEPWPDSPACRVLSVAGMLNVVEPMRYTVSMGNRHRTYRCMVVRRFASPAAYHAALVVAHDPFQQAGNR